MGKQKSGKERGRFSSKRKADAVLRLLRGEALDELSRELGVTAATLSRWRDEFLAAGQAGLKSRERTAADDEVLRLKALVGDLTMRLELARAARRATRFEALEPIRQGVRERFGVYAKEVARGLVVRHDHGSQYVSDDFQNELRFLGIASSPSFVRSPEGNGCIERFFRTLKEQLLWTRIFRNAEEVRHAVQLWAALYNEQWLIERHGHRPPAAVRHQFLAMAQAA